MRPDIIRNLTTSLVLHNRVVTSAAKAKQVKQTVDRLLAKVAAKADLKARRELLGYFYSKKAVAKIFELIAPNLQSKRSGFVQVFKLPPRVRDSSERALLVLLPELLEVKKEKTKSK